SRQLDLAREPLRLAARILGRRPAGLGLGPGALPVDAARLRLRGRLLGLCGRTSRRAILAGVFPAEHLWTARFLLFALAGNEPRRVHEPPVSAAELRALLLWRLLRGQLFDLRVLPVVRVWLQRLWLRSVLYTTTLA